MSSKKIIICPNCKQEIKYVESKYVGIKKMVGEKNGGKKNI